MNPSVRLIQEADLIAADRVLRAAFARPTSFLPHMRLHLQIEPRLFYVAELAGEIVGTVGAVNYDSTAKGDSPANGSIAYIGLMAVDPAMQRRGIARQLIEPLLGELDARGCERILLDATPYGAPLYESLGFSDDGQASVYELRTITVGEGSSSQLTISRSSDLEEIDLEELIAFDAVAFGASRRKLLAALWPLYRERLLVARGAAGTLEGYLFARDPTLGPWVATCAAAAEALLGEALRFEFEHTPHVLVPRSNRVAEELLLARGFVEQRRLRHMRRGGNGTCGRRANLYGQSSFAHG